MLLTNLANEIGLKWQILEYTDKKPIIWMSLLGSQLDLDSIVLNSHMDVVPANPVSKHACMQERSTIFFLKEYWDHDPFEAFMDEDGNIFARGSQDTKGIGIQYLEAIRQIVNNGEKLERTVHVLFVPDEEEGIDGMEQFVASSDFPYLKPGFVLDEGEANPGPEYNIFYAEKAIWREFLKFPGFELESFLISRRDIQSHGNCRTRLFNFNQYSGRKNAPVD